MGMWWREGLILILEPRGKLNKAVKLLVLRFIDGILKSNYRLALNFFPGLDISLQPFSYLYTRGMDFISVPKSKLHLN